MSVLEENTRQACGERLCAQCECWKDSMLMWFTQRQVWAVVVLVGQCRSGLCCISVNRFGVENFCVETRGTTGEGEVQIEINAVASLRDRAHFTQRLPEPV